MNPLLVITEYFTWQYSYGILEFFRAWMNIHWFLFYFFSFPILIRTLFQPLFRIKEEYGKEFDLQRVAESLIVNIIMRITGFVTRVVLLLVGVIVQCAVLLLSGAAFILFLLSPLGVPLAFLILPKVFVSDQVSTVLK